MVVPDANVLLYAVDTRSAHHEESLAWLDSSLGGGEAVGFSWTVLLAFIRVATSPTILPNPLSADEATAQVQAWLGAPAAVVLEPTTRHGDLLRGMLIESGTAGNLTTDAHLAVLAMERGYVLHTTDADFARFPGLRWVNPFIA